MTHNAFCDNSYHKFQVFLTFVSSKPITGRFFSSVSLVILMYNQQKAEVSLAQIPMICMNLPISACDKLRAVIEREQCVRGFLVDLAENLVTGQSWVQSQIQRAGTGSHSGTYWASQGHLHTCRPAQVNHNTALATGSRDNSFSLVLHLMLEARASQCRIGTKSKNTLILVPQRETGQDKKCQRIGLLN